MLNLNTNHSKILLIGIVLIFQGCLGFPKISSITLFDKDFNQVRTLNREEISSFANQWNKLKIIKRLPSEVSLRTNHYKIDILTKDETLSRRWIYYPSGYMAKLNKKLKPAFVVEKPDEFSAILGI